MKPTKYVKIRSSLVQPPRWEYPAKIRPRVSFRVSWQTLHSAVLSAFQPYEPKGPSKRIQFLNLLLLRLLLNTSVPQVVISKNASKLTLGCVRKSYVLDTETDWERSSFLLNTILSLVFSESVWLLSVQPSVILLLLSATKLEKHDRVKPSRRECDQESVKKLANDLDFRLLLVAVIMEGRNVVQCRAVAANDYFTYLLINCSLL